MFFKEAKMHLERESGRTSLTSIFALCILFSASACEGKDRAGMIYRVMAYEMLTRMKLDKRFTKLSVDVEHDQVERRILSRAAWGLFCFERYYIIFQ
jgi:hypothetical protein